MNRSEMTGDNIRIESLSDNMQSEANSFIKIQFVVPFTQSDGSNLVRSPFTNFNRNRK